MHALIENSVVTQYPYSLEQLKRANPNTSFPKQVNDNLLASFGVQRVFFSTQPQLTNSQVLEEGTPVFSTEDQRWTQVWTVRNMTAEEITNRDQSQAASVREVRNTLLVESDWTQVADSPVDKTAWTTYRQALRDISTQPEFPWAVAWPQRP